MTWFLANIDLVWRLALVHMAIAIPPIVLGFVISLPLGWLAARYRGSRAVLLTLGTILYTIPSLALFIVIPVLLGTTIINPVNLVVALTIYAVALMVRATADALASVDADVRQSATAVGFSGWQRFWRVELPLSGPVMLAGLRVVSVTTVSLVSVGAVIGVTSLGYLFTNGYQRRIIGEVVTGVVSIVLIALVFDVLLVLLGRLLMPWTRRMPRSARAPLPTLPRLDGGMA
ncbi:ABC transporter permease subunit [Rathayibacter sp. YIM 133350]|uniref:ABC transporter permease n=1 Tax=Rathayibacter sp. YIM 133350 TaxID=3131992 RepID=UPI00307CDAB0